MPMEGLNRKEYQILVQNIKIGLIRELYNRSVITDEQFETLMNLQISRSYPAGGEEPHF